MTTTTSTKTSVSLLARLWYSLPVLCAGACLGLFVYVLIFRGGPREARLLLEIAGLLGLAVGVTTYGSVVAGERLLTEEGAAEPVKFREAGWLLGVPPGLLAGMLYVLMATPSPDALSPDATFIKQYLTPLLVTGAVFALVWAALARVVARQAGLKLADYACALFMDRETYWPLAGRKLAWRAAHGRTVPSPEAARELLPDIIPALADRLKHSRRVSQNNLLIALLGNLDDPAAVPVLQETLQEKQPARRKAAAVALGKLKAAEAVPALAELAVDDTDPGVRRSAVVALGKLRAQEALPALQAGLQDAEPRVRQSACVALAKLKAGSALPLLQTCLEDENEDVRKAAARAIEVLTGDRPVEDEEEE